MRALLLTAFLFGGSLNLFSQVPGTLSYQGILMQSDGITPLTDGAHSIVFSFYTVSTGGSALFTRTISVTTSRGLYTCIIGGGVAPNAPFNSTEMNQIGSQQNYIGIKVDAGTELLPRVQLTTSPYSLRAQSITNTANPTGGNISFWGTNNTISSDAGLFWNNTSKRLGIGTSTPGAGLEVKDASILLTHTTSSPTINLNRPTGAGISNQLLFSEASTTKWALGGGNIGSAGPSDFSLYNYGLASNATTILASNNYVGIGTTSPQAPLHVTPQTATYGPSARSYFSSGTVTSILHDNSGATTINVSIRGEGNILASSGAFVATSDKRIKEIITRTDNNKDLKDLLKIEITDYKFIDKLSNGDRLHKKVIAQELQKVYPMAVNVTEGIVPNVFEVAKDVKIEGNITHIETNKPHQFSTGDEVKLILEKSGEKFYKVTVRNENEFLVNEIILENVFVYGKNVNDLLTVDYDALTTLNISATQALNKEIDELKAKLLVNEMNLHENFVEQEAKIDELKVGNRNLLHRLELIESLLSKKSSGTLNASK